MKLETSLYGAHSESGERIEPNGPVELVKTDDDMVILTLGNLKSPFFIPSRIEVSRDETGWVLSITHEGDDVAHISLPTGGEAILTDRR